MSKTPRDVALAYADCLEAGDFDRLVTLHHPDMVCSLLGRTIVSGCYRGRDAFFAHTFRHVLGQLRGGDEIYLKGARVGCASDSHAALLLHGGLPTVDGGRYDQNYLQLFHVVDGLIVEIHELLDTVMLDTQVFGKRLLRARAPIADPLRPASRSHHGAAGAPGAGAALSAAIVAMLVDGRLDALGGLLHADCVVQVSGTTPVSGVIDGAPAIGAALAAHLAAFRPGSYRCIAPPRPAVVDDDGLCVLAEICGERADGAPYRQILGIVAGVAGDRIAEIHLYFDTAAEEAQSFANPLLGGSDETAPTPFQIAPAFSA